MAGDLENATLEMLNRGWTATWEPMGGTHVETAIAHAVDIATRFSCPVSISFNGSRLYVEPGDDPRRLLHRWTNQRNAKGRKETSSL